ncbi:MAG: hypothetical protein ABSH41_27200 [Syntrophobacteraceae bacterium]|jgi:hypothetical protein
MNDPFIQAGLALGLVLVAAYTICLTKSGQIPDLAEAIRLLFASLGAAAGTRVLTMAPNPIVLGQPRDFHNRHPGRAFEPGSRDIRKIACQSGILINTLDSGSKALPE